MRGAHCLKTWSSTQKTVALSSGEAELTAAVKAATESMGMMQLMEEMGEKVNAEIKIDSAAALGTVHRKGNGKLRHVRIGMLWIQQLEERESIRFRKVAGTQNPADVFTKHLNRNEVKKHCEAMSQYHMEGKAQGQLEL